MKIKYSFAGNMSIALKASAQEFHSEHYNRAQEDVSFEYSMEGVSMELEEQLEPQEIPSIIEGISKGLVSLLSQQGQNGKAALKLNAELEEMQAENAKLRKENFDIKLGHPKKDDHTDHTDYREVEM